MIPESQQLKFPFSLDTQGRMQVFGGDDAIQGKIIQVLFTAPGERINNPEFGCGLFNLVFEPNNELLAAAMEFTIGQALVRWMDDDIIVEGIQVTSEIEKTMVEIAYSLKRDLSKNAVRVLF
jgi:phage baseplate assembly protein W